MIETIGLKSVYSSSDSNILTDFYTPALKTAVRYDRITGYFSPKILALGIRGITGLVKNRGTIRIITSVHVDTETYNALSEMNDGDALGRIDENVESIEYLQTLTNLEHNYLELFKLLVRQGTLRMKIAIVPNKTGILHEKIGIIEDIEGKKLSFSGSNNETVYGWTQNIEEFKVFPEWQIGTVDFFNADAHKFDSYWNNEHRGVRVLDINQAFIEKRLQPQQSGSIDAVIADIERAELTMQSRDFDSFSGPDLDTPRSSLDAILQKTNKKPLREYQKAAIEHWRSNGYRGVFEMATGTGKTVTSINALKSLREDKNALHAIVLVPLVTLAEQWKQDIVNILDNVTVIVASSSSNNWRDKYQNLVNLRNLNVDADYIIITTYSSFGSARFTETMADLPDDDIVLIGDEMHNIVTETNLQKLDNNKYLYRLGLSATPTRLWKPDESNRALELFGAKTYQYDLRLALEKGFLVPYAYHIHRVYLSEEEYEEYVNLSKEISQLSQMHSDSSDGKNSTYQFKLIQRARIKKQAENKLQVFRHIISNLRHNEKLKDTLIYVDSEAHLSDVQEILTQQHARTTKFTGNETLAQRLATINNLRTHKIDAIVAIKCLDEGVDIPSAHTAFFLANNTDPREYVQRLGRVLRLDPDGDKQAADIHDFLVLPSHSDRLNTAIGRNLLVNEFRRAFFFKKLCYNKNDIDLELGSIMDEYGYYISEDEIVNPIEEQK